MIRWCSLRDSFTVKNSSSRRNTLLSSQRQQKGLALITVMLIVTLATLIASSIIKRQSVDIKRTSTILGMAQSHQYLLSLESAAFFMLKLDFDNNGKVDHPQEQEWNSLLTNNLPGGEAEGNFSVELLDLQGLFNLNTLSNENPNSNKYRIRFAALLAALSIESPEVLAENVQKWLNQNSEVDDKYLDLDPPYRAAYQPFSSISELLLIDGIDQDIYKKIKPYVSALPPKTTLNVNTAPVEVLQAIHQSLSRADAEKLVQDRGEKGYENGGKFVDTQALKQLIEKQKKDTKDQNKITADDFAVMSEYFEMFGVVNLGDRSSRLQSVIKRDKTNGTMTVLSRDLTQIEPNRPPET